MDKIQPPSPVISDDLELLRDAIAESRPNLKIEAWQCRYAAAMLYTAASLLDDADDGKTPQPGAIDCAVDSIRAALAVLINQGGQENDAE